MNKFLIIIFEVLILLSLTQAADVAMVVKDASSLSFKYEQSIKQMLEHEGHSITLIDKNNQAGIDYSDYDLILIVGRPSNVYSYEHLDDFVADIPVNEHPTLAIGYRYINDFGWGSVSTIYTDQLQRIFIPENEHMITSDYSGYVTVHTVEGKTIQSLNKGSTNLTSLASIYNNGNNQIISVADSGTKLSNGDITQKRVVFFGINYPVYWTEDAKNLFLNSIQWILNPEDLDSDGFPAYFDCDDEDSLINPDAIEVPYDGVDNNCDGFDLADVDGDGYCKEDYLIINKTLQCPFEMGISGTDCNDNDPTINPGSEDSIKNCVNELPLLLDIISPQIWEEDDLHYLDLSQYFSDPDGDRLEFNISKTSDDENITVSFLWNGLVRFEGKKDWNGEDWVIFSASDGKLKTETNNVSLVVLPINDAPVLDEISDITVNESDLIEFNVSAIDVDGDVLAYCINQLPEGAEFVNQLFSWTPNYFQAGMYYLVFNVTDGEKWDKEYVTIRVKNINRAPVLETIEKQIIQEDISKFILVNASDLDEESLIYEVINKNTSEVNCRLDGSYLNIVPALNWNGNASCEIQVSDGDLTDMQLIEIEVLPANDAPVLQNIDDIALNENELVEIFAFATDVEEDVLTYSINDSKFTDNGNGSFSWQTNYTDSGTYYFNVSVSDGELSEYQIIKVIVRDKNKPPVIEPIGDAMIDEDSGFSLVGNLTASDFDGVIAKFEVAEEKLNEVDCEISENVLGITPAKDFYGNASCVIRVYDDDGDYDEATINILVNNINDAPEIILSWPDFNPLITENGETYFRITWKDIDSSVKNITWYKDDVPDGIGEHYTFIGDGNIGESEIKVIVDDGEKSDSVEWIIETTKIPIAKTYDGSTTDFTGMTDVELEFVNLVLEKTSFGKIEFLEPVDLRDVADLDRYSDIQNGLGGMDSNVYPVFKNKKVRLTFYNLNFEKTPTLYYDSKFTMNPLEITQICSDLFCSNINYEDNELSFEINGFSSFMAGDTLTCEQQGGNICGINEVCKEDFLEARDSNFCCPTKCVPDFRDVGICEVPNSDIKLTIKNPDDGDVFKPGKMIEIEVKIKNNLDEKVDFDVGVFLYDLSEGKFIESAEENIKIKSGELGTIDLNIEIPEDIEEREFYVFIKVQDDDNESLCNEDYVKIEIEREDDDVVIDEFKISPIIVSEGDLLEAIVKVKNIGSDEQEEVYVVVENKELGIYEKSEEFDIEEFDKDDTEKLSFLIRIPEAEENDYELKATVFFADGDEKNSRSVIFSVMNGASADKTKSEVGEVISLGDYSGESLSSIKKSSTTNEGVISLNSKENQEKANSESISPIADFFKTGRGIGLGFTFFILLILFVIVVILIQKEE
jgi:hypothetical protein